MSCRENNSSPRKSTLASLSSKGYVDLLSIKVKQRRKDGGRAEPLSSFPPHPFTPHPPSRPLASHILNVILVRDPLSWSPHRNAPYTDLKDISPFCPSLPHAAPVTPGGGQVSTTSLTVWGLEVPTAGLLRAFLDYATLSLHLEEPAWPQTHLLNGRTFDREQYARYSVLGWHPVVPPRLEMCHGPPVQQSKFTIFLCFLVMWMAKIITTSFGEFAPTPLLLHRFLPKIVANILKQWLQPNYLVTFHIVFDHLIGSSISHFREQNNGPYWHLY